MRSPQPEQQPNRCLKAVEHVVRHRRASTGPAYIQIRFVAVKPVVEAVVGRAHDTKPAIGENNDTPHRHAKHSWVARHAQLIRRRRTRHNSDCPPRRQIERIHGPIAPRVPNRLSIHQQVNIRIVRQRHGRRRAGTIQQPPPNGVHHRSTCEHRRAWGFGRLIPAAVAVAEQPAIAVVTITLGRSAIGDQDTVTSQLDVEYLHLARAVVPDDRTVIDQVFRGISTSSMNSE